MFRLFKLLHRLNNFSGMMGITLQGVLLGEGRRREKSTWPVVMPKSGFIQKLAVNKFAC